MIQALLILLVGLLSVLYLYFHFTYKYWLKKGILQETPTFVVGNLLDVVLNKANAGWIYNKVYFKYKNNDAVGFYEFQTPKLIVRTPELFETILIKDFSSFYDNELYANLKHEPHMELNAFVVRGEKWKPARNSLIMGLTKNKLKDMYEFMKNTVHLLKNYIDDNLEKEIGAMDLAHLFMMTNVSNTVYGIEGNCFTDHNALYRQMVTLFAQEYWQSRWLVLIIFYLQGLRDFLGITYIPKKVSKFVEDMVRQVVEVRVRNDIKRNDFLNHYLNQNKTLEDKITEIIKIGTTFFVGGFDTSSLPSGNLIYELALNPTIQEDLYKELDVAYGGKSEVDYDTLVSLPLLDKAFKEVLRKYPLMYCAMKMCTKTTTLQIDGKPVKIDKGVPVVIPVYAMQHDPQYYPDPEVFDPERFSEEAVQTRHPCTWLPFGAGPRICAGMNFGLLQAKLLVASVVYNYKIEPTEKTPPKISFKKSAFFIVPEETQWIRFVKRR